MSFECEIKEQPPRSTLCVRTRTPLEKLPDNIGRYIMAIAQYLGEIGEQPAFAPYVAYYNMDMANLDVEIGFPVARKLPGKGEIKPGAIPGGKAGTCMYVGPYQEMPPAYEALTKLVMEKGMEPTGIAYEFYFNGPMDSEPSGLKTLIMFPLKG
jgi:effector-binding domain-containing protein